MKLVDGLSKLDRILSKAMPLIPIAGLALGAFLPEVFINLRPLVPWLFGTLTLSGALKLKARELGRAVSSPFPFLLYFLSARIFFPLTVFLLSSLFFRNDPDMITGLVLMYSVPVAVTSLIWVSVFKGDLALALTIILLDTLLAPIIVPGTVRLLLGAVINLDFMGMVLSLSYMILLPTIIGVGLNEASQGKIPAIIGPWFSPFSKIALAFVMAGNTASVAPLLRLVDFRLLIIVIACICLNLFGFICGKLLAKLGKLDKGKDISFFITAGLKNNSLAMVLGIQFFPAAAALLPVIGFVTQHIVMGIMGRVLTNFRRGGI